MIGLDGITHAFGDTAVLDGVDLTVADGEFVALIGPNGAGKTTLLRTINGVIDPDEGAVLLDGTPVADQSARQVSKQVATVPQETHVGFDFTAEQLVAMGRTPHQSRLDWRDDADPVQDALERTGTTHLHKRAVGDLSGGEKQQVLLARALAQEPSVLVLDEPTASLDINHQVHVLELVTDIVADGHTAVAAIHDLDLAARYCDRLVLLHDGQVAASGPPATVLGDDTLADAFDTTTAVTRNHVTGTPTITAMSDRQPRGVTVHVIGSGTPAATAVSTLWRAGFDVTVGPVPAGDVTASLVDSLELEAVTVPAFEPPDATAREDASELARTAAAVVRTANRETEGGVTGPSLECQTDVVAGFSGKTTSTTGDSDPPVTRETVSGIRGDGGDSTVVTTPAGLVQAVTECTEASE